MKRSSLIKQITNYLKENTDIKWLDIPHREIAVTILDIIEEAGMKPPLDKTCPVLLTVNHHWEKEDA